MKKLLLICLLALTSWAHAVEVAGVRFDDTTRLGTQELQLNGAGLRTRFFIKVYAAGLYLPEKKNQAADVLTQAGTKRLRIVMLREISASQFVDAMNEGLSKNLSEVELAPLKSRIDELSAAMLTAKTTQKGDVIHFDWNPGSGTRVTLNDKPLGKEIPGDDLFRAVMRIWLGDKPVQDDLKNALLGKTK